MESMNGINESCFLPFKKAAHNTAEMSEIDGKPVIRPLRENEKAPECPGLSVPCRLVQGMTVEAGGIEPPSCDP